MNFSIWFTAISIFFAILIAIFKFDEWEILKLKKVFNYFWLSFLFLLISGISAYFESNSYPKFLNIFWISHGIMKSGDWSLLWFVIFIISMFKSWKLLTSRKPSKQLIKKYCDYIEIMDSSKFSSLFRKYEKFFFNTKKENTWIEYELLLSNERWWSVAPFHFKELILNKPEKFYRLNPSILKSLLTNQLKNIPNSLLSNEIENISNSQDLNEDSPILNIFLSNPYYIEKARDKDFFTTIIKEQAELYFASSKFINTDCKQLSLKPSYVEYKVSAPMQITLFYYIELINIYWIQVLNTQAKVSGFYFYEYWLKYLLEKAPILHGKQNSEVPNYFILAAKKIINNISYWIRIFEESTDVDMFWAYQHFLELKEKIILQLQNNFLDKIECNFFITTLSNYFEELIKLHNKYPDKISFVELDKFNVDSKKKSFVYLANEKYVLRREKEDLGFLWLKETLGLN